MCGHLVPASHVICGGGYMCGHLVPASHPTSYGIHVSSSSCAVIWSYDEEDTCAVTWYLRRIRPHVAPASRVT